MANNYASGTFAPYIPANLITDAFKKLADAVGLTIQPFNDDGDMVYLFNEDYCTSGYIENEDGAEKEVTDEDLYAAIQDIIRNSEGKLTWVSHEQAYTCDKMRPGEFGGSAVFITADDIQYHGTSSWLERRIAETETGDLGPDAEDTGLFCGVLPQHDTPPDVQNTLDTIMPEDTTVNVDDAIEAANDLIEAAKVVVERWESGNLAEAVTNLSVVIGWTEQTLDELKSHKSVPMDWEPASATKLPADINKELLEACIQARAALPDAWHAVQCDTPKEVIELLNRAIARAESANPTPINLAIVLDGGLVQAVVTDTPEAFKGVNTMIIDYDCDAADPHDDSIGIIPQPDGGLTEAFIQKTFIDRAGIDLSLVNDFITDERYGANQERFAICGEYPCEGCKDGCLGDDQRCVNEDKCIAWQYYNESPSNERPIGANLSISDDDLCSTCHHLEYKPGEESLCTKGWPCKWNRDDYVVSCPKYIECAPGENWLSKIN